MTNNNRSEISLDTGLQKHYLTERVGGRTSGLHTHS